tara:strand:- start:2 stop:361 length:360 start_codon:yes stop_codon:yes gene_type:complete
MTDNDFIDNIGKKLYNGLKKIYDTFTSTGINALKFYSLLIIILLSFASLIPLMTMKPPCEDSDAYQNKKNCTLLGETDDSTMLEWIQNKYLAFYIMSIVSSSICIILAIVLMFFVLDSK